VEDIVFEVDIGTVVEVGKYGIWEDYTMRVYKLVDKFYYLCMHICPLTFDNLDASQ
jgi:hypothetical protein